MANYPCGKCKASGPIEIQIALKNANPGAPVCESCGGPVDAGGQTLESRLGPAWQPAKSN